MITKAETRELHVLQEECGVESGAPERENQQSGVNLLNPAAARERRVDSLVRTHYDFVWRTARSMGLARADAEDVAQRVMLTATIRIDDLVQGKEKAFLFRTTHYVVRRTFRAWWRRREQAIDDMDVRTSGGPAVDELTDQRRALLEFEEIIEELPEKLRIPFLLFDVEGWSKPEIAEVLRVAVGTVASRIQKARRVFKQQASRQQLCVKVTT